MVEMAKKKGGLAILVRNQVKFHFLNYHRSKNQTWEIMVGQVIGSDYNITIILCYIPPGYTTEEYRTFTEQIDEYCDT